MSATTALDGTRTTPGNEPLPAPILISGSFQRWDCHTLVVLGLLGAVGAVFCWSIEPVAAVLIGLASVASILAGFGLWISRSVRLKQVTITSEGFLLHERGDTVPYRDRDVLCMSLANKHNYANGEYQSTTRKFTVWIEEPHGTRKIVMTTKRLPLVNDPLEPLVTRISHRLHDEAKRALAGGHRVEGRGWSLERDALLVKAGRKTESVPLADISAADVFDGSVCLWCHGEEDPAVRIPEAGENAFVLLSLIRERLEGLPADEEGESLGRLLFERRPARLWFISGLMLAPVMAIGGLGLVMEGIDNKEPGQVIGGSVMFVVAMGTIFGAIARRFAVFRCHERGVRSKKWYGERRLRFDDLAAFTFHRMPIYVKGAYAGMQLKLKFEPLPELNASSISYGARVQHTDESLDTLRDQVSRIIATHHLMPDWRESKPVAWLDYLVFYPAGVRYRPSGFFGRKPEVFLPYAEMDRWQTSDGKFLLWMRNGNKPAISESCSQRNFFPGLALLMMILKQ